MDNENQVSDDQTADEASSSKVERSRWTLDADKFAATVTNPDGTWATFVLFDLPPNVVSHLIFTGFKQIVGSSDDMNATFYNLMAGKITTRKPASSEPKLNLWRQAIAHAMVEATKKSAEPLTLEAAKAKAASLTKEQVRPAKTDATVVKHYNKLTGVAPAGVAALLAA